MTILIPMAGAGSRFASEGYQDSKPLIDVLGLPMIARIIENLPNDDNYVFIVRKDMHDFKRLNDLLTSLKPKSKILTVEKLTRGAAETCLLAKDIINNSDSLLIANCDQIHDWNLDHFKSFLFKEHIDADGAIVTFKSNSPKHSYAKIENGVITEVAEKKVISNYATTGVYFWRKGLDFVQTAESMINQDIRTNNEFYVCPTYNELIASGKKVVPYHIETHWSIGTPEELRAYLALKTAGKR